MSGKKLVPELPSGSETSEIEIRGWESSFWIVALPWLSAIVALTGFDRL